MIFFFFFPQGIVHLKRAQTLVFLFAKLKVQIILSLNGSKSSEIAKFEFKVPVHYCLWA